MKKRLRYFIFSLLPTILLLGSLELTFRLFYIADPELITAPLPDEFRGLARPHDELFWVMNPNMEVREPNGAVVKINRQGFRGPDLLPKALSGYRILALGESTTFGAGVDNDATYSAILERTLNKRLNSRKKIEVLNCGFSAYSSFQGLKYLELFGLNYNPDMLILYFEINDYMPSTLRNHGLDERTARLTDVELHDSRLSSFSRKIINYSKFLTYLQYRYAAYKVKTKGVHTPRNPFINIGIQNPILNIRRLAVEKDGRLIPADLNEYNLGMRVSEKERLSNLEAFQRICNQQNISLVIVHPAYAKTHLHQCILTDFCLEHKIPIFEAFHSLHPSPNHPDSMFSDNLHPSREGHRVLAVDLADFLMPLLHDIM